MGADFNRVLVVGASSRVGQMLVRAWGMAGLRPVLQHRRQALAVDAPQLHWSPLDQPLPQGASFDAMIVLAGAVPGRGDLADNARIAHACLTAAKAAGIPQVLLASSSAVYGANGGLPCAETDPTLPLNAYGQAKLAMEALCPDFRAEGLNVTALRIGNVAGADALLLNTAGGRAVAVDQFADGNGPLRSYIGPQSLAAALVALVGQDLPAILNLAAPHPVAMADLAAAAGADWHWQPAPATAQQTITLNCDLMQQHCPIDPAHSTATALVAEWHATRGAA